MKILIKAKVLKYRSLIYKLITKTYNKLLNKYLFKYVKRIQVI